MAAEDVAPPPATEVAPAAPAPPTHFPTALVPAGRMAVTLTVGAGRVVTLAKPATSLFAADAKVAEVRPASPTSVFLFGIAPGRTTIAALGAGGQPIAQIDLTVRASAYGSREVTQQVRAGLHFPGIAITANPGGYTVTGTAETPAEAERVLTTLRPYLRPGQTIDNRISVTLPLTVNLQVKVVEISRTVTRELGINWSALYAATPLMPPGIANLSPLASAFANGVAGGLGASSIIDRVTNAANPPNTFTFGTFGSNRSINATIDALAQDQLATILAEPNLTAQSGETASFLAGGEYPIPVAQENNTITIDYKQYGVSLAFVPTVISPDRISLKVRPEVSQLTTQGAINITAGNLSLAIPALTVRRAETTVELGSGQSFAIAGLLLDNTTQNASGVPLLGELPILGPLFRSTAYQRGQTELVIIVTPYLVRPVSASTALTMPTRGVVMANDLDRILYNRQLARGVELPPTAHIPLDVGFINP